MTHTCKVCKTDFQWEFDFNFHDRVCPHCHAIYRVEFDESYDEESGDEFCYWWLELKNDPAPKSPPA